MRDYDNLKTQSTGLVVGASTFYGSKHYMAKLFTPYYKSFHRDVAKFTQSERELLRATAQDVFRQTGLERRGVILNDLNEVTQVNITSNINKKLNEKVFKLLQKTLLFIKKYNKGADKEKWDKIIDSEISKLKDKVMNKPPRKKLKKAINTIVEGKNAAYIPSIKEIIVNMQKTPMLSFHEMGHAMNNLGINKVGKALALMRPFILFIPVIMLVGVLKNKKQEGEATKGIGDKITTFIKDNAGKLTAITLLPTIAEEGLASLNAKKMLKSSSIDKSIAKKVNMLNLKAWGTYLLGAFAISQAVRLAVYARDKITDNKNIVKA